MLIRTKQDLEKALKQKYSSVGSYPIHFITLNNELVGFDTVAEDKETYLYALDNPDDAIGSEIIDRADVLWEGIHTCSITGETLETAYE